MSTDATSSPSIPPTMSGPLPGDQLDQPPTYRQVRNTFLGTWAVMTVLLALVLLNFLTRGCGGVSTAVRTTTPAATGAPVDLGDDWLKEAGKKLDEIQAKRRAAVEAGADIIDGRLDAKLRERLKKTEETTEDIKETQKDHSKKLKAIGEATKAAI